MLGDMIRKTMKAVFDIFQSRSMVRKEKVCQKGYVKNDLTKFIGKCIIIIKREEENGTLSNEAAIDIVGLIGKACDHLFHGEPELLWEVHEVMKPAIRLLSEQFKEQIANQEKQTESHILNFIRQYKKDGKTKTQTRLALQEVFSFMPSDAEEKIEKYW